LNSCQHGLSLRDAETADTAGHFPILCKSKTRTWICTKSPFGFPPFPEQLQTDFSQGFRRFAAVLEEAADGILVYGGDDVRIQRGVNVTSVADLTETLRSRIKD
jgi:hypothetical protein